MANLSETNNLLERLPRRSRRAIIGLIDRKTEGDMQAVLDRLDALDNRLSARIDSLETKMDANIGAMEKSISNIKWFIGIAVALDVAASRLLAM